MKLINLLIRELDNCSLEGYFRVSRLAEICQFDRFSLQINFKRARSCNYGIPNWVQVKMKIQYFPLKSSFYIKQKHPLDDTFFILEFYGLIK